VRDEERFVAGVVDAPGATGSRAKPSNGARCIFPGRSFARAAGRRIVMTALEPSRTSQRRRWIMVRRPFISLASLASVASIASVASLAAAVSVAACSNSTGASPPADAGGDTYTGMPEGGSEASTDGGSGDSGATTTIAQARASGTMTPISVVGIVTAVHGVMGDQSVWYIEDPAGGPLSGIAIYCDPALTTCSKSITAPPLNTKVLITGPISMYMGQLQIAPTAQTILQMNATPPPAAMVTVSDLAPTGTSMYRGVYVKLATKLTVDSVTPPALYDTQCASAIPDGGADAAADAAAGDAGSMPSCSGCAPPTYSGFQANDGSGHEIYIENYFFNSEPLQSSPECLTQPGAVPVTDGMTFSSMAGVLDFDGYASAQDIMPVQASDYVTP
jgi:hypothetical protein